MVETETPNCAQEQDNPPVAPKEITKQTFRLKVWGHLENNRLASFPRPAFGRIPNFKGADLAAKQLLELDEFKTAKYIEVNPDKPLEFSRVIVLENQKELFVPVPRLKDGLLKKLCLSETSTDEKNIKQTVSRWGIEHTGTVVGLDDVIHLDLLVLGSVAVSKQGYRIGKGRGYADLEYAILRDMKAVDDSTVIVTTVHDTQVFDELPEELFQKYDVPVDFILTPTQIIKVEKRLPRPEGIMWEILSQRRVNLMQILQKLKEKHTLEGKDVTLKEADSDVEAPTPRRRFNKFRRFARRRPRSESKTSDPAAQDLKQPPQRRRRYFRRTRSSKKVPNTEDNSNHTENSAPAVPAKRSRNHIDFSLVVSNIERNVRVRDLKNALNENGIKPDHITWRGFKGFCYLHYAKPKSKKDECETEEKKQPFGVDNVIDILQKLKIHPESTASLNVKVVEPITRIETTDVTAV